MYPFVLKLANHLELSDIMCVQVMRYIYAPYIDEAIKYVNSNTNADLDCIIHIKINTDACLKNVTKTKKGKLSLCNSCLFRLPKASGVRVCMCTPRFTVHLCTPNIAKDNYY